MGSELTPELSGSAAVEQGGKATADEPILGPLFRFHHQSFRGRRCTRKRYLPHGRSRREPGFSRVWGHKIQHARMAERREIRMARIAHDLEAIHASRSSGARPASTTSSPSGSIRAVFLLVDQVANALAIE